MVFRVGLLCLIVFLPSSAQAQDVEKKTSSKKSDTAIAAPGKVDKRINKPIPVSKTKPKTQVASQPVTGGKIQSPKGATYPSHEKSAPEVSIEPALISYFNQDAKGWLRAGQMVHITMQGTPGAHATFHIEGLSDSLAMLESAPGQYLANWTVPSGKSIVGLKAVVSGDLAMMKKAAANSVAPTMQASRPLCVDTVAPSVSNILPAAQSTVTTANPTLSLDYQDAGSGIDVSSVRLLLNGRDLTGEAVVTTEHLVYKPLTPLPAGDQSVEIIVTDNAGNVFRQTWHFTVALKK